MTGRPSAKEYDWSKLVAHFVHPIKVAIVEEMFGKREPLSANGLVEIFRETRPEDHYNLPNVAYHLSRLAAADLLVKTREVQRRGATEKFYVLR